MKKIKMKRNREVGDVTYFGDREVVVDDSIADKFIAEGHAVFIESLPDKVKSVARSDSESTPKAERKVKKK